jgi:hypothetical protein
MNDNTIIIKQSKTESRNQIKKGSRGKKRNDLKARAHQEDIQKLQGEIDALKALQQDRILEEQEAEEQRRQGLLDNEYELTVESPGFRFTHAKSPNLITDNDRAVLENAEEEASLYTMLKWYGKGLLVLYYYLWAFILATLIIVPILMFMHHKLEIEFATNLYIHELEIYDFVLWKDRIICRTQIILNLYYLKLYIQCGWIKPILTWLLIQATMMFLFIRKAKHTPAFKVKAKFFVRYEISNETEHIDDFDRRLDEHKRAKLEHKPIIRMFTIRHYARIKFSLIHDFNYTLFGWAWHDRPRNVLRKTDTAVNQREFSYELFTQMRKPSIMNPLLKTKERMLKINTMANCILNINLDRYDNRFLVQNTIFLVAAFAKSVRYSYKKSSDFQFALEMKS